MTKQAWLAALAVPLALACAGPAAAQCEEEVAEKLRELGISQTNVESVQVTKRQFVDEPRPRYEYNAWVKLRSCSDGALVVHMTDYCYVQQTYTQGNCQVSEVPQY